MRSEMTIRLLHKAKAALPFAFAFATFVLAPDARAQDPRDDEFKTHRYVLTGENDVYVEMDPEFREFLRSFRSALSNKNIDEVMTMTHFPFVNKYGIRITPEEFEDEFEMIFHEEAIQAFRITLDEWKIEYLGGEEVYRKRIVEYDHFTDTLGLGLVDTTVFQFQLRYSMEYYVYFTRYESGLNFNFYKTPEGGYKIFSVDLVDVEKEEKAEEQGAAENENQPPDSTNVSDSTGADPPTPIP